MDDKKTNTATRIFHSEKLTSKKWDVLENISDELGIVRNEVWNRYGSVGVIGQPKYDIRSDFKKIDIKWNVPGEFRNNLFLDAIGDIQANREAVYAKVKSAINKKYPQPKKIKGKSYTCVENAVIEKRKDLFVRLKTGDWDNYLNRLFRKYFHRGHNHTHNQIILHSRQYNCFVKNGRGYFEITGISRCNYDLTTIVIPMKTTKPITSMARVILKDGYIEIHHTIDSDANVTPAGTDVIGLDKGYTECFVGSDGQFYGSDFGNTLTEFSDKRKKTNQARNKLFQITEKYEENGNLSKADNIRKNNLGKKKKQRQQKLHQENVKRIVFEAVNRIVDNNNQIVVEDLTKNFKSKKNFGKDMKRRLNSWQKGLLADALTIVSDRRRATLSLINPAYTSQICHKCGSFGKRIFDKFHCALHGELQADINASMNILERLFDPDIKRYTPYKEVYKILLDRITQSVETLPPGLELHTAV